MKVCPACNQEVTSKTNKFCNQSCAASFNNRGVRRHGKDKQTCSECPELIGRTSSKFCSLACQKTKQIKELTESWLAGEESGLTSNGTCKNFVKKYLKDLTGDQCSECGWCKVNPTTGRVPIEVDHIDGNHNNNRPQNLRLLCPNCHSLTSTYRALNKGNGRASRRTK